MGDEITLYVHRCRECGKIFTTRMERDHWCPGCVESLEPLMMREPTRKKQKPKLRKTEPRPMAWKPWYNAGQMHHKSQMRRFRWDQLIE